MFGNNYDAHLANRCKIWISRYITILIIAYGFISNIDGASISCPTECNCKFVQKQLNTVLETTCSKGNMRKLPTESMDISTEVINIIAPSGHPNFLSINKEFIHPHPFSYLQELHVLNSNINSIGHFPFWGLQHLTWIDLRHNKIEEIYSYNFKGLNKLNILNLDDNMIQKMPKESFTHLTGLKKLTLSNNHLKYLEARVFYKLENLQYLDISYNPLQTLKPEVFSDIRNLRILKCRKCLLNNSNINTYNNIKHLQEIDISDNLFTSFTSQEFKSLNNLKQLNLDGNFLSVIVDNMFCTNYKLRILSIAHNKLKQLTPAAFNNLSIFNLDISFNKVNKFNLEASAPLTKSLTSINLSGNDLTLNDISVVLKKLPRLISAGLSKLFIQFIPENFFLDNHHLSSIDLSCNKLETIPIDLISKLGYVKVLNISHNKINSLGDTELRKLESMTTVDFSNNPWHCNECTVKPLLRFIKYKKLNRSIQQLVCSSPVKLKGTKIGNITISALDSCQDWTSMLLKIFCILVFGLTVFYHFWRAFHHHTNEETPGEQQQEQPDELQNCAPVENIATIHASHHLVSRSRRQYDRSPPGQQLPKRVTFDLPVPPCSPEPDSPPVTIPPPIEFATRTPLNSPEITKQYQEYTV